MAKRKINSIIDRQAIETELAFLKEGLTGVNDQLKAISKQKIKLEGATSIREINNETKALNTELDNLKKKNIELSNQQKAFNLEVAKEKEARRQAAQERKEQLAAEKQASLDAVNQQREKNALLQDQKRKTDELAQAERNRAAAETQRLGVPTNNQRAQLSGRGSGSGISSFIPSNDLEASILTQTKLQAELDKTTASKKLLISEYGKGNIAESEYQSQLIKTIALEKELQLSVKAAGKEVENNAKIAFAAPSSIDAAKARVSQLSAERNAIPTGELATPEDIANVKSLNDQIDIQNKLIDDNSDKLTKQKINIGNYPKAFTEASNVVKKELNAVSQQLSSPGLSGKQIEDLTAKQVSLSNAITITGKDFTTQTALSKSYQQAAAEIGRTYGTNSEIFRKFTGHVAEGGAQVVQLDKQVKTATVGGKGLGGIFSSIGASAVSLARILPGLGIAGLIGFAVDPIIKWATAIKEATGDAKILQDVIKDGAKGASEQVAILEIQRSKLTDITKTEKERREIAEQYNKTAAEGNKISLEELSNITAINTQIDKQIGLIEKQALAKAAQAQIAKFADEAIQAEFELQKALRTTGLTEEQVAKSIASRQKAADKALDTQRKSLDGFNKPLTAIDKNYQEPIRQVELVDKKLEGLLVRKKTAAAELNRVIALLKPELDAPIDNEKNKANSAKQIADLIKAQSTEFDVYKLSQQRKIDLLNEQINDEKVYYTDKLNLLKQFTAESQELINRQEQEDIKARENETKRQIENLNKDKAGKTSSQLARINENIKILEKNLQEDLILIRKTTEDKTIKLLNNTLKQRKKINDDQLKVEQDFEKDRTDSESAVLEGIDALNKKRLDKEIKYQKDYKELVKKYATEIADERIDTEQKLASRIESITFSALDSIDKRKIDILDRDLKNLDARTQRQIDGINQSGLAEEERARLIADIEKNSLYQKQVIEEKKEAIEKRRAELEKKGALISLALETAATVFNLKRKAAEAYANAMASENPAIKATALSSSGAILSKIPGVLASAALAAIKLSFFKEGKSKENKYEGFAVVGDGGRSEIIQRKSGLIERTPSVPTLTHVMADDIIHKDENAFIHALLNAANPFRQISMHKAATVKQGDRDVLIGIEQQLIKANRKQHPGWRIERGIEATPEWNYHFKQ